ANPSHHSRYPPPPPTPPPPLPPCSYRSKSAPPTPPATPQSSELSAAIPPPSPPNPPPAGSTPPPHLSCPTPPPPPPRPPLHPLPLHPPGLLHGRPETSETPSIRERIRGHVQSPHLHPPQTQVEAASTDVPNGGRIGHCTGAGIVLAFFP